MEVWPGTISKCKGKEGNAFHFAPHKPQAVGKLSFSVAFDKALHVTKFKYTSLFTSKIITFVFPQSDLAVADPRVLQCKRSHNLYICVEL